MSTTTWERTFVIIKPDGIKRGLAGAIISRFERAGLKITASKLMLPYPSLVENHYEEHRGKPYFNPLVDLLTSGPVMILALEGAEAIRVVRKINGSTQPIDAAPGTIRGDFGHMSYNRCQERLGVIVNLVHASDSRESASRELALWFKEDDFVPDYKTAADPFM